MASPSVQKSVVVTGGTSGIGLAMARHFASEGHKVAVLDINDSTGPGIIAKVAEEYPQASLCFKRSDVSSWEDQAAAFEQIYREHGRIDIVMANAGISEQGQSSIVKVEEDIPVKPDARSIDVNFLGVLYCTFSSSSSEMVYTMLHLTTISAVKLALHYMHKNKDDGSPSRGSIIVTASNAGLYPFPVAPLYGAAKAALINLVRSLAPVKAKSSIQINALAPAVLGKSIQLRGWYAPLPFILDSFYWFSFYLVQIR